MSVQDLLKEIRQSCSAATWSRGVELARAQAVVGEEDDGDEIALRVSTKGGLVSPQVVLFPNEPEWSCECNSREDACAHAAAAAIALKQAWDEGKRMPGEGKIKPAGRIAYRLTVRDKKIALARVIVHDGKETVLNGSIAQVALGKVKGPKLIAADDDLRFEKKLGSFGGGIIPRSLMKKVLDALEGTPTVTLEGEPIKVGKAVSGLAAKITEEPEGYKVQLLQDPDIEKIFANGAMLKEGVLAPVGESGLMPGELDALRRGRVFHKTDMGTLVGELLPRLRRRIAILSEITLPGSTTARPRIQVNSEREGDELVVLPTILYGEPAIARLDGERLTMLTEGDVPLRNPRLEEILRKHVQRMGLEVGTKTSLPPAEAIDFVASMDDEDMVSMTGPGHKGFFAVGELNPHLEVREDGSFELWFEDGSDSDSGSGAASGSGSGKLSKADGAALVAAWERGENYAPLMEGGFGKIPMDWLARHGHHVVALLSARQASDDGKAAPVWAGADVAALCEALEQPAPPVFDKLRPLLDTFEKLPPAVLPDDLTATLRDYQSTGVAWLGFVRDAGLGALLADDMGLGKTLQTLCALRGRTLVVAPTSVLHNWANEIRKFRPSLTASVYHGPQRAFDDADVTLTTYALLRLDIEKLCEQQWDTVVLDEAQAIKNPDSQVARAAYQLQADFRIALTGTPVENRLDDLWSQFHFLNRGLLGGRSDFGERYVKPISSGNASAAQALRKRISPFLLRRLKREVATELPPRTDVVLRCELSESEQGTYNAIKAATQSNIMERLGEGSTVMAMLEALLRLRQASCHSALVPGNAQTAKEPSSKIRLLLETLDGAIPHGHKALVFSQWTSLLDLVEPHLKTAGIDFIRLDGTTRDRQAVVDTFQSDDGPPVMLISLRAGGTGLNLTAADHVFLLDPWWNPAVEDQAADRAHRIGQENPVLVHRLVAKDTVEERILALQDRKRQLADAAIGGGAGTAQITRAELLALLA